MRHHALCLGFQLLLLLLLLQGCSADCMLRSRLMLLLLWLRPWASGLWWQVDHFHTSLHRPLRGSA